MINDPSQTTHVNTFQTLPLVSMEEQRAAATYFEWMASLKLTTNKIHVYSVVLDSHKLIFLPLLSTACPSPKMMKAMKK